MVRISDDEVVRKWQSLKSSAETRGLPFSVSLAKVRTLLSTKKCYYTGVPFDRTDANKRSIDRVDSDQGYCDDNVVACGALVNSLKSNFSYKLLKTVLKGMEKHALKQKKKAKRNVT